MTPQAITCSVILGTISTRADGSLTIRLTTPEISATDAAAFLEFRNCELKMLLQKDGEQLASLKEVKGEFDWLSPGQRLRNTLWVWWEQNGKQGDFNSFYLKRMNDIIENIKAKLT